MNPCTHVDIQIYTGFRLDLVDQEDWRPNGLLSLALLRPKTYLQHMCVAVICFYRFFFKTYTFGTLDWASTVYYRLESACMRKVAKSIDYIYSAFGI